MPQISDCVTNSENKIASCRISEDFPSNELLVLTSGVGLGVAVIIVRKIKAENLRET